MLVYQRVSNIRIPYWRLDDHSPQKPRLLALFFGPNLFEVRDCQPKLEENDENMIYLEAQGKSPILNETAGLRVQGGPPNPTN